MNSKVHNYTDVLSDDLALDSRPETADSDFQTWTRRGEHRVHKMRGVSSSRSSKLEESISLVAGTDWVFVRPPVHIHSVSSPASVVILWDYPEKEALLDEPMSLLPIRVLSSDTEQEFVWADPRVGQTAPSETTYTHAAAQVNMTNEINRIFGTIEQNNLDNESESRFVEQILGVVRRYEGMAINEIQHLIMNEKVTPESAETALCALGDMDDEPTHNYRRWLLEQVLLESLSPIVRDAANVGLSYMDDPHAIASLNEAIKTEKLPLLREVMKKTLDQLEETQKCRSSCT